MDTTAPAPYRLALGRLRPLLRDASRGADLAWLYAGIVLVLTVALQVQPDRARTAIVLRSSTNLENLRSHPIYVLLVSGFVVSSPWGLWVLPALVAGYGTAQRWLGRGPTLVAALIGHVGATLFTAVLLVTGIVHGRLDPSIARVPDVGVSYGLACVAGLLLARVPARGRYWYALALLVFFPGRLLLGPTFTEIGHATALLLGFGLALLASRAARAAVPRRP